MDANSNNIEENKRRKIESIKHVYIILLLDLIAQLNVINHS